MRLKEASTGNLFLVKVSRPVWMNNLSRKPKRLVSIFYWKYCSLVHFSFSVHGSFEVNSKCSVANCAEKQRIAEEVASILKLSVDITASERLLLALNSLEEYYLHWLRRILSKFHCPVAIVSSEKVIAALRAGSEYVGCDVQNCILVAGSQSGVLAAERIGMPCVVVRCR